MKKRFYLTLLVLAVLLLARPGFAVKGARRLAKDAARFGGGVATNAFPSNRLLLGSGSSSRR